MRTCDAEGAAHSAEARENYHQLCSSTEAFRSSLGFMAVSSVVVHQTSSDKPAVPDLLSTKQQSDVVSSLQDIETNVMQWDDNGALTLLDV